MKSPLQVKSDERDNHRLTRWLIVAIVVVLAGVLSYNFLARERAKEPVPTTQSPATQGAGHPRP